MQTNLTEQEQAEFIESLYNYCNEEEKKIYDLHNENKEKLLQKVAFILLLYKINGNIMELSLSEKIKIKAELEKLIIKLTTKQISLTKRIITEMLFKIVKDTFDFYNYENYTNKDIEKIVNEKYKGKTFIKRIEDNEENISNYLNKKVSDFVDGDIDVNTINDDVEKTYKQNKTNVITLAESEVNRAENIAFLVFAKSIGVTKVIRNEVLDSKTCDLCKNENNKIYDINKAPNLIHPRCRGFNQIYSYGVKD